MPLPDVKKYARQTRIDIEKSIGVAVERFIEEFDNKMVTALKMLDEVAPKICPILEDIVAEHYAMLTSKYGALKKHAIEVLKKMTDIVSAYAGLCTRGQKEEAVYAKLQEKIAAIQNQIEQMAQSVKGAAQTLG